MTRLVIPLLLIHIVIVCLPLFVVPDLAWSKPFIPTLEGQYIIKNLAIIALAIGIAAQTKPFKSKKR
jgi:putative oxidoreductase